MTASNGGQPAGPVIEGAAARQQHLRRVTRRNLLIPAGPLLSIAGLVTYFTWASRYPVLRDVPWLNLPAVFLGVALAVIGTVRAWRHPGRFRGRATGPIATILALAPAAILSLYVFVWSADLPPPSTLTLGLTVAPELGLADQDGRTVRLADFAGKKLVIIFYRGSW